MLTKNILQGGVHWCANSVPRLRDGFQFRVHQLADRNAGRQAGSPKSAPTTYKLPLTPKSFRQSSIPRKLFRYYTFCSKLCGGFFQVFSCIFY